MAFVDGIGNTYWTVNKAQYSKIQKSAKLHCLLQKPLILTHYFSIFRALCKGLLVTKYVVNYWMENAQLVKITSRQKSADNIIIMLRNM